MEKKNKKNLINNHVIYHFFISNEFTNLSESILNFSFFLFLKKKLDNFEKRT